MRFNSRYGLFVWPTEDPKFSSPETVRPWVEMWLNDPDQTFKKLMALGPAYKDIATWLEDNLTPTENAYDEARKAWAKPPITLRCEE